jgi:hypothetical protein
MFSHPTLFAPFAAIPVLSYRKAWSTAANAADRNPSSLPCIRLKASATSLV